MSYKDIKIQGVVLSRKNIGEADRLLTVFSDQLGKIKIIAKAARKIKSKMAPHIELFTIGDFYLVEGKTFYILTGAESKHIPTAAASDIDIYGTLSYLCELVDLTYQERESNIGLFGLLSDSIGVINDIPRKKYPALICFFEAKLLVSLGYKPNFNLCNKCQSVLPEVDNYTGSFEGVSCELCGRAGGDISKNALKILRIIDGVSINDFLNINITPNVLNELKETIHPYLLSILPREPKSLDVL